MKTIYLLRHAKSSWKDESLSDIERPLNGRGKKAADTMGAFLKREKILVDLVLSSSAVRARQTTERVLVSANIVTDVRFDERIYEAGVQRLVEIVRQIENGKKNVVLVGHNPGFEELLEWLTGTIERMQTGALAKIGLKTSTWDSVREKSGTLEWIVRPKQLPKD
ncbi:MAG TPA: histidine phosphatase family protein [Pyrinomonadaceae bacterium]|nr:histidine phosphatase family protein [Pyrinomonadaceae bacterium]